MGLPWLIWFNILDFWVNLGDFLTQWVEGFFPVMFADLQPHLSTYIIDHRLFIDYS